MSPENQKVLKDVSKRYVGAAIVLSLPIRSVENPAGFYVIGVWEKGTSEVDFKCDVVCFGDKEQASIAANQEPGIESSIVMFVGRPEWMEPSCRDHLLTKIVRPAIASFHANSFFDPTTTFH